MDDLDCPTPPQGRTVPTDNPYSAPSASLNNAPDAISDERIDALPVSASWKLRFKAINRAGGVKLPNFKSLPKNERRQAMRFNLLAFFFGPLYYASKGMWKKAFSYFAAAFVLVLLLALILTALGFPQLVKSLHLGVAAAFATRANLDFYKKAVLNDNGWW
ncbi:MAG: DUF2628 domain-containing protein [Pseudomonas sp.]|uniref:DUF2628 domain-containing protein n=1 Tax=Pseudomonas sp. TaxID=306 RepID=UPI00339217AB